MAVGVEPHYVPPAEWEVWYLFLLGGLPDLPQVCHKSNLEAGLPLGSFSGFLILIPI